MNPREYQRYDPLLRIRKTQEQLCAQKLAETMMKIKNIEQEIKNTEQLQKDYMSQVQTMQKKSHKVKEISDSFEYIVFLGKQKELLDKKKGELEDIAQKQRKELEQIMIEEKMLQKLRDNRERVFRNWVRKEIQKDTDDLSGTRFSMKNKEAI
ncbi:MAG: flagellar export protein FliJ [Candidatus Hydrogenedens sp.]